MSHPEPEPLPVAAVRNAVCRHHRHKAMLVYTDDASRDTLAAHDGNHCWCARTLKGFGPDDELVAGDDCRDLNRECYEAL